MAGHAALARSTSIPVALGEQFYKLDAFKAFLAAGAQTFAQPDVTRLAGITEHIQVADLAHAYRLSVAPRAGEMSQVHVHLSYWHPPRRSSRPAFCALPQQPGARTTPQPANMERYGKGL